jgi:hypothetical protein
MRNSQPLPTRVHGIDWSGARDAGRRIWIATAAPEGGGARLTGLQRAEDLPGATRSRDRCLPALRQWLSAQGACAVGMDFPFGLPLPLIQEQDWVAFVRRFAERFADPEAFRRWCLERGGGREHKRVTDVETRTPFCPYNLRMYRQTYWGIAHILMPLVGAGTAVALPMQAPRPGVPWLLETCPASVLKRSGLYRPYKGVSDSHRGQRRRILDTLIARGWLAIGAKGLRQRILGDAGGDALDAVVAVATTARVVSEGGMMRVASSSAYALEAYVYT